MPKYPIAERFKAVQGEGVYTGTPMAFIRFVGCSVGKGVCTHCDTDFDKVLPELGGGIYTTTELLDFVGNMQHVCLTGGEPLDRDLSELVDAITITPPGISRMVHIETSGTVNPSWLLQRRDRPNVWVTVSPKPGYDVKMIENADEVKVILGGLGDSAEGWPTITDALDWVRPNRPVYVQPRNGVKLINKVETAGALDVVLQYPTLCFSAQLHKYINSR